MTHDLVAELRQLASDLQVMDVLHVLKFKHPAILASAAETIARQRAALNALAKSDFHDGNCASLAVASSRVRNVALVGLGLKNENELEQT